MSFKELFISRVPDGDPKKYQSILETPKFKLFVRVVKNQEQAIDVCKKLIKEEGIHSIVLCPGFTHQNIAEISNIAGKNVGVSVARSDSPSSKATQQIMKEEGWFS